MADEPTGPPDAPAPDLLAGAMPPVPQMPEAPAPPELVPLRVGTQTVQVAPDVARVFEERDREMQRRLSEAGREMQQLRQAPAYQPQAPPAQPATPNYDTALFEKPTETLQQYGDQIRQQTLQQAAQMYQRDQLVKDWWGAFRHEHNDLDQVPAEVIFGIGARIQPLPGETAAEGRARLADETRKMLLAYSARGKDGAPPVARPRTTSTIPSGERPAAPATAPAAVPTMSQQLRAIRAARQKPAAPTP